MKESAKGRFFEKHRPFQPPYAATRSMPAQHLLVNGCWNTAGEQGEDIFAMQNIPCKNRDYSRGSNDSRRSNVQHLGWSEDWRWRRKFTTTCVAMCTAVVNLLLNEWYVKRRRESTVQQGGWRLGIWNWWWKQKSRAGVHQNRRKLQGVGTVDNRPSTTD